MAQAAERFGAPGVGVEALAGQIEMEIGRLEEADAAVFMADLGIAESCLRRWIKQDDIDAGRAEGLSTDERAELVRLRRENRVQAMEIEILKRASAYFAREAFPGPK